MITPIGFALQLRKLSEQLDCRAPLDRAHHFGDGELRGDFDDQVDMIRKHVEFNNFAADSACEDLDVAVYGLADGTGHHPESVLGAPHQMILTMP